MVPEIFLDRPHQKKMSAKKISGFVRVKTFVLTSSDFISNPSLV